MEDICRKYISDLKTEGNNEVCGYIKSQKDYDDFFNDLTLNGFSFSTRSSGIHHRLDTRITFDENGYPYSNIRHLYLTCCRGQLYYETNKSTKRKQQDHIYGKERVSKGTKKMGCQSKINIKTRVVFTEYLQNESLSKHKKYMLARVLRHKLKDGLPLNTEVWFFIQASLEHNHEISKNKLPIHPELKSKIEELVENGITSIPEIKEHLNEKVKEMFKDKPPPDDLNSSLYPKRSKLYSQVYRAYFSSKDSNSDQETLENKKEIWKNVIKTSQQSSGVQKKKSNRLVLLRRRLKSMLDLSYKIENEEYLDPILKELSSIKKQLSSHQKKELLALDDKIIKKSNIENTLNEVSSEEILEQNQEDAYQCVYVVEDGDLWRADLSVCEISVPNK